MLWGLSRYVRTHMAVCMSVCIWPFSFFVQGPWSCICEELLFIAVETDNCMLLSLYLLYCTSVATYVRVCVCNDVLWPAVYMYVRVCVCVWQFTQPVVAAVISLGNLCVHDECIEHMLSYTSRQLGVWCVYCVHTCCCKQCMHACCHGPNRPVLVQSSLHLYRVLWSTINYMLYGCNHSPCVVSVDREWRCVWLTITFLFVHNTFALSILHCVQPWLLTNNG